MARRAVTAQVTERIDATHWWCRRSPFRAARKGRTLRRHAEQHGEGRQVTVGQTVGDVTALRSGVAEGDNIVVSGQSRLTDGTSMQVTQVGGAQRNVVSEAQ